MKLLNGILDTPVQKDNINPCQPSPCGPNSQCKVIGSQAACSCLPNYIGQSPNCRPECTMNPECPSNLACINERCKDPCDGSCGVNAKCSVINHNAVCTCIFGYEGDPTVQCSLIPQSKNFLLKFSHYLYKFKNSQQLLEPLFQHHAFLHLVDQIQNAEKTMEQVLAIVLKDMKAIRLINRKAVVENVREMRTAHKILLALEISVLILVLEHVDLTPFVKLQSMYQFVLVPMVTLVIHSFLANKYQSHLLHVPILAFLLLAALILNVEK